MIRRPATHVATLATILAMLAIVTPGGSRAEPAARAALTLAPESELWMEGKSSVHDWESRTRTINVVFKRASGPEPSARGIETLVRGRAIVGMDVRIPVASLHSEKKGLDKNMLKALRADRFPTIHFRMDRYSIIPRAAADTLKLHLEGALTVSGTEKRVSLDALAWKSEKGEWIDGAQALSMSEFGIKPPTMMLGTLKVRDRIVIHYHLLLVPDTAVASASKTTRRSGR